MNSSVRHIEAVGSLLEVGLEEDVVGDGGREDGEWREGARREYRTWGANDIFCSRRRYPTGFHNVTDTMDTKGSPAGTHEHEEAPNYIRSFGSYR